MTANIQTTTNDKDETTIMTKVHAARTWDPEELARTLETLTAELEDDEKNPSEVFARAVELDIPLKELGMLISWVEGRRSVWLSWIPALKAKGWQTCELRALYRYLCFEQLDIDDRPNTRYEWVRAYLLNSNTYGEGGELEELFGKDDQSSFVEFVRAAATEMPEEFEEKLELVLRFRVRQLKLRPGERREPLTEHDAALFQMLVPWLDFAQREEIRWTIAKSIRIVKNVERYFAHFTKEQRFGTTNLTRHVPNVKFAGRMLLEYFPYYYRGAGEYFTRIIERATYAPGEDVEGNKLASRTPDVYRMLLKAGDQGRDKPNRWLTSEWEKWWQESVMLYSGWLILTLTIHASGKSGRFNLQAAAPSDLRVHGFPPKLVLSLTARQDAGRIVHWAELPDGRSFLLKAGDRVMVRRDFHCSAVAHRTHDTAIFHAHPTKRTWSIQNPWSTDVMVPLTSD